MKINLMNKNMTEVVHTVSIESQDDPLLDAQVIKYADKFYVYKSHQRSFSPSVFVETNVVEVGDR